MWVGVEVCGGGGGGVHLYSLMLARTYCSTYSATRKKGENNFKSTTCVLYVSCQSASAAANNSQEMNNAHIIACM